MGVCVCNGVNLCVDLAIKSPALFYNIHAETVAA